MNKSIKDKKARFNRTVHRILEIVKPYKKTIIILSIISIIINILELLRPYLVKVVIDDYLSKGIYENGFFNLTVIGIIYIVIVLIVNLLDFVVTMSTSIMGENVVYNLRNKLFKYIEYAKITFHDKTSTGKLFVRVTNDVEDISTLFKDVITTSIKDIVMIFALIIMMFYLNFKLSILALTVIPICTVVMYFINRTLNRIYEKSKNIRTKLNTFLAESIYGIKLIKVFNRQKEKMRECKKYNNEYYNSRKLTGIFEGLLPATMDILKNLGITIIVVACVNRWFNISLDVGLIYVFITYIGNLFDPIVRIIENTETLQEAIVSIDKIYEILEIKDSLEDLDEGRYITNLKGKIEFKNVWFAYEKNNYVLKDISFTINPHESVALVGKTGSRKNYDY